MITKNLFGITETGEKVHSFTLENKTGAKVTIIELGCAIQSFIVPLNGESRDIVLGFDTLDEYEKCNSSQGAFVGRFANRIKNAVFKLNGITYCLDKNDGNNHLHGVLVKRVFTGSIENDGVSFRTLSKSMEEGFPGNLDITVTYTLSCDGSLSIDYKAVVDDDTIINLTNHSYFNLDGAGAGKIYNHTLWLNCKNFCEGDSENCPTGEILPVAGTPMDFTCSKLIGKNIKDKYYQLEMATGYDHNFIIDKPEHELAICAMAKSSDGSLVLETYTTQPGVQFYTGNYLSETGKKGQEYKKQHGFCLEAQHFPCSTTFSHFPCVVLKKGEQYHEITIYKAYMIK